MIVFYIQIEQLLNSQRHIDFNFLILIPSLNNIKILNNKGSWDENY